MFAENLANKLIGLLVTVGVLAAVYFFAIKPILDTTENAFNSINGTVDNAFEEFGVDNFDVDGNIADIQQQIRDANLDTAEQRKAERLLDCIKRVRPDTSRMQNCAERFQ